MTNVGDRTDEETAASDQPIHAYMAASDWLADLTDQGLADFVEDHLYMPLPAMDPVSAVLREVITRLRNPQGRTQP